MPTLRERFDSKYRVEDTGYETPCWLWTDRPAANGYGYISIGGRGGRKVQAHVVSWELHVGERPQGKQIDHLCRVRICVNWQHLEPVTQRENLLRGETITATNAAKTHCDWGHEFNEKNTYITKSGSRACRPCGRRRDHARRRKETRA